MSKFQTKPRLMITRSFDFWYFVFEVYLEFAFFLEFLHPLGNQASA